MNELIQTVTNYLANACDIQQVENHAAGKFLQEVEIDPKGLLSPWAEFVCDCMQWVRAANKILEQTFTIYDFDKNQEPTRSAMDVNTTAAKLANDRMNDVAVIYELRGQPMSLTYGSTKQFANWPRLHSQRDRIKALLTQFTPNNTTKAQLARDTGLSATTIGRIYSYANNDPSISELSYTSLDALSQYFNMPLTYIMYGNLPEPECKYL